MNPGSLRHRLLILLVLLPLSLFLTGVLVFLAFERAQHVANEKRLTASAYSLMGIVEPIGGELVFPSQMPEPEFNQPHGDWLAVARALDGRVLWSAPWSREDISLPAPDLPPLPTTEVFEYFRAAALHWPAVAGKPVERRYNLLRARVSYEVFRATRSGSQARQLLPVVFEIWQDANLLRSSNTSFLVVLGSGLGFLSLLLGVSLWAVIRWTLRPLSRVVDELQRMQTGDGCRFEASYPLEIRRLTDAMNDVLTIERRRREQFRERLGDLAHSLKTPLALLRGDVQSGADRDAEEWLRQIDLMDRLIAYHLKRAVSGAGVWHQPEPLRPLLDRLLATLHKVYAERRVSAANDVPRGLALNVEQTDLLEIFGNLLDNAFKYGGGAVWLALSPRPCDREGWVAVTIEDNGPGIPADRRQQVLGRGQRLDSREAGQGIGLAVVNDLVRAYGGALRLDSSVHGGLAIEVTLPGSG